MQIMKSVCMPLARAGLTVFSVSNFFLTWLLLFQYEWLKNSLGETPPLAFYYGKTIVHVMVAIALVALAVLAYLWIVKPAFAIFYGNRGMSSTSSKIVCTDGALYIISLASYLAVVVTICAAVMANNYYVYVP